MVSPETNNLLSIVDKFQKRSTVNLLKKKARTLPAFHSFPLQTSNRKTFAQPSLPLYIANGPKIAHLRHTIRLSPLSKEFLMPLPTRPQTRPRRPFSDV